MSSSDIFRAIYYEYQRHRGDTDPYTLTEGRLHEGQAPKLIFPYIIMTQVGGPILWMFGNDRLEDARIQFGVYDRFERDSTLVWQIWDGLVNVIESVALTSEDGSQWISFRREGLPRGVADEDVYEITGDWILERQVTRM